MRLAGKVAIISGSASGMGTATARMFAREGAKPAPLSFARLLQPRLLRLVRRALHRRRLIRREPQFAVRGLSSQRLRREASVSVRPVAVSG